MEKLTNWLCLVTYHWTLSPLYSHGVTSPQRYIATHMSKHKGSKAMALTSPIILNSQSDLTNFEFDANEDDPPTKAR